MAGRYRVFCTDCKKIVDEIITHTRCDECGGVLDIEYDMEGVLKKTRGRDGKTDLKRTDVFDGLSPVKNLEKLVTLKEGNTPLYKTDVLGRKYGLDFLYVKNEGANPTGVFKDRGSCVEVTKALEVGAKALIIASSGNMAASCSAYASKAGLKIYVLVPESTPVGKLSQILSYGAHVIKIKGDYSTCVHIAEELAVEHGFYQAGDYVFRREGQKTLAYEIAAQLNFVAPDVVVVPTGAGTHIAGLYKGFLELKLLGVTGRVPRMAAVQPQGCPVIADAYRKGLKRYKARKRAETVCSAVAVTDPSDGNLALKAVRESRGCVETVSDEAALDAQKFLAAHEGLFVEPSSALAVAVLGELKRKRIIGKRDKVVCVATGNGLKDPLTALQNIQMPKTFEADTKVVGRYIKSLRK